MNNTKIYLAGGMQSKWRNKVRTNVFLNRSTDNPHKIIFFDPSSHGLEPPNCYTTWDLHHIKNCDIFFGCMEKDNPSGIGLALEIGYAKALGKTIILVDETIATKNEHFAKYYPIVRESADVVFENLADGIDYLKSFI